jgi:FMN phosphatase YigB (HAD superfamily)
MTSQSIVFLVDVDETLMHTDQFDQDVADELERWFGSRCRQRYCAIEREHFATRGYRDYLGALQRYRVENPNDIELMSMSSYLVDYPFASRLYPGALDVLKRLETWGKTVVLTDGDIVLQPRKVEHSGIFDAVKGRVLIYIHKEKAISDIERRYPARHYVLVDDKLRILTAFKHAWGDRVTTVFPRQGHFGSDSQLLASYPAPDVTVNRIGDLLEYELPALLAGSRLASANLFSQDLPQEVIQ